MTTASNAAAPTPRSSPSQGDNLKKTIELHKTLGNKFLICPSLTAKDGAGLDRIWPRSSTTSPPRAKESACSSAITRTPATSRNSTARPPGKSSSTTPTPTSSTRLDTGNTLDGGGDPLALIKKYPGRTKTTHIKEHGGAEAAAIGEGTIDWKTLLEAYETVGGTEWYIVEHEQGNTPMQSVKACIDNLRKMGR